MIEKVFSGNISFRIHFASHEIGQMIRMILLPSIVKHNHEKTGPNVCTWKAPFPASLVWECDSVTLAGAAARSIFPSSHCLSQN